MGSSQSSVATQAFGAHTNGLKSLLDTGEHADLKLRCVDGREFMVHKAIVCAQSEFFPKACKPEKFKVGRSCTVGHRYQEQPGQLSKASPQVEGNEGVVELTIGDATTIGFLLNFLYTMSYVDDIKAKSCLITDVNLYIAADFYAIETLKSVAAAGFQKHLTGGLWKTDSFPKALELIYNDTFPEDRRLRDVALAVLLDNASELIKFNSTVPTELTRVIESLPELSKDIAIQSLAQVQTLTSEIESLRRNAKKIELTATC
ncbi:hypothetical protein FKW77_000821 [Venturia effusa]|uniref:BTB domain-containing protein n=1 Tax=Venturia effusa TaxID=50376 RepID=A0A517L2M3_9PEZI|nr:hypothetical protein FKW77_000821 [Venturia effusa]